MRTHRGAALRARRLAATALCVAGASVLPAQAAPLPEIRMSAANTVPNCVTPERLMAFLRERNGRLDRRYREIAALYKRHGEPWRVRWDYAFFQMAVETNFLTYRRADGTMGDVDPRQNNFAGLGTTGGGVPGDSFPDISTGVLAQIQHLVVYSGEAVARPVAPRTQLKQDVIVARSRALNRPVLFSDLAGRWAADRKYANAIASVAGSYRQTYCMGAPSAPQRDALPSASKSSAADAARDTPPVRTIWSRSGGGVRTAEARPEPQKERTATRTERPPLPKHKPDDDAAALRPALADFSTTPEEPAAGFALLAPPAFPLVAPPQARSEAAISTPARERAAESPVFDAKANPPSGLGMKPDTCSIDTASFGGTTTVLIRSGTASTLRYTALSIIDGFERSMIESFIKDKAPGGKLLGSFPSKDAALAKARELCPDA